MLCLPERLAITEARSQRSDSQSCLYGIQGHKFSMDTRNSEIDFNKLERELAAAVDADKKYSRENAAKFRAVEQRVGSYDEFRNIVLASNLQPLEKKDIEGVNTAHQVLNPYWNSNQWDDRPLITSENVVDMKQNPETADSFVKQWRRHWKTNKEKYERVVGLNGQQVSKIMSSELLGNLLGEVVVAFNECFVEDDSLKIITSLKNLSINERFTLNLQFLNKHERKALNELLGKLSENVEDDNAENLRDVASAFRKS